MSVLSPNIRFYAGHDGRKLAARVWQVDEPIADVIYLHGIVSHSGWYEASCAHLASHGFQVHFLDRRGSGLNTEDRGDVDAWQTWVSDVIRYMDQLPQHRPRIILGISWGGILATCLARRHPEMLSGLGLICPGLFSYKSTTRTQKFALRLGSLLGLSRIRVAIPLQDPALFTNSVEHQRYIAQDPLSLRRITVGFATCSLDLWNEALEAPQEIHLPVLLALASAD